MAVATTRHGCCRIGSRNLSSQLLKIGRDENKGEQDKLLDEISLTSLAVPSAAESMFEERNFRWYGTLR